MLQNGKTKIELSVERMRRTPNAQENGIELAELVVRRRTREVQVLQALQSDRFLFEFYFASYMLMLNCVIIIGLDVIHYE